VLVFKRWALLGREVGDEGLLRSGPFPTDEVEVRQYRTVHSGKGTIPLGLVYESECGVVLVMPRLAGFTDRPDDLRRLPPQKLPQLKCIVGPPGSLWDIPRWFRDEVTRSFSESFFVSPDCKESENVDERSWPNVLISEIEEFRRKSSKEEEVAREKASSQRVKLCLQLSRDYARSEFGQRDPMVLEAEIKARRPSRDYARSEFGRRDPMILEAELKARRSDAGEKG